MQPKTLDEIREAQRNEKFSALCKELAADLGGLFEKHTNDKNENA